MTCSGLLLTRLYRRPHLALLLRVLRPLLASVGGAPGGGQLGRGDSQQIRQGRVHHYGLARGRSHTLGDIHSPGKQGVTSLVSHTDIVRISGAVTCCRTLWLGVGVGGGQVVWDSGGP